MHILNKEFEKFKKDLLVRQNMEHEKQSHNFNEEVKCLKDLWKKICEIVDECGKFDIEGGRAILAEKHDALEEYLFNQEPFVSDVIAINAKKLLDLTNPENYKPEIYEQIKDVRKIIIEEYRNRLAL
jgi:hypothetical protein